MLRRISFLLLTSLLSAGAAFAQDMQLPCGIYEAEQQFYLNHPEKVADAKLAEKQLRAFTQNFNAVNKMTPDTVIIPVVFHIIHNYGPENIGNDILYESIERLNIDFMANNEDLDEIVDDFVDVIGNPQFEFRLAQKDPLGNCTTGITRTVSSWTTDGSGAQQEWSGWPYWPRNEYLNIWIVRNAIQDSPGTAAYSRRPWMVATWPQGDGIVCGYNYLGIDDRTLTHEVAHWANIIHVWGPNNNPGSQDYCTDNTATDECDDTPKTVGHLTSSCNTSTESCESLDNIQNYMDYAGCPTMFTVDQSDRMIAAMNSPTAQRNQIWAESNMEDTGVDLEPQICVAEFRAEDTRICTGSEVEFENLSGNGETEWSWTFEGGDPATSDEENPTVFYNTPGLFEVSLTISNGTDEASETKTDFVHVLPNPGQTTPILEGFEDVTELPNEDWYIESTDENRYWEISDDAASSGSQSAVLKNYYQDEGDEDLLESNPIDLSNLSDVHISYDFAFAMRNSSNTDIMKLKITKNCGTTWIVKSTLKAATGTLPTAPYHLGFFTPEDDEWGSDYIDNINESYLIEDFRFRFEFKAGDGNNIYLDNINIFDPATVGINEVNKAALGYSVYPNPVENTLKVRFNLLHKTEVIGEVYDISGRKVADLFNGNYPLGINEIDINTSDWNAGMYMVRITLEGESFIEKVIKN